MFQDFMTLISIVEKDAPAFVEVWQAGQKVLTDLIPSLNTKSAIQPTKACTDACERFKVACNKHLSKAESADPSKALGDGTLLKAFLAFMVQILPFIAPFLQPTPTA